MITQIRTADFADRSVTARLLQLLAGLMAFVAAAEMAARLDDWYKYGASPLAPYNREGLEGADEYGVRGKPYARFEKWRLDNLGFRGPDVGPKQAGRPRIVVMGSSETFGLYEQEERDWPSQLRGLLKARGVDAELINAAFYGFGLQLNLTQLERRILPLHPDVIVLYLDPYSGHYLTGIEAARSRLQTRPAFELRLGRKAWSALQSLIPRPCYAAYLRALVARERRRYRLQVYDRVPPEVDGRIRADLQRFVDLTRQHGARLILTSHVCRTDELALLMRQRDRAALTTGAIIDAHQRVNALLAEVAAANQVPFVDLAAAIPAAPELVVDASHFSNEGSRLVAEQLVPAVIRELTAVSPDS